MAACLEAAGGALEPSASASRLRETQRRDMARHRHWARLIAGSYALDELTLALFAYIEVIPWSIPLFYGAAAAVACAAHRIALARAWNIAVGDTAFILPLVYLGAALQLFVVASAPQIAFPYVSNLFTVFAIGMTWLGLRHCVVMWSAGTVATGLVFYFVGSRIGAATASPAALFLSWMYFSLVLGRLLGVSLQANAMRMKLAKSRQRLGDSLAQIEELVHYDDLTKAFNRRTLLERLDQERSRAERTSIPFTVAILDLDYFKQVNDHHGHAAGDALLKMFVETVHQAMRETDVFGRYGGEEFLLLLNATIPAASASTLDRIRRAVEARNWDEVAPGQKVTFSAGVAGYRPAESIAELLHRADLALYRAKRAGRNCVVTG